MVKCNTLSHCPNDISPAQFCSDCICVCVSDWFLFYGLASRELVIRRNKSALLDLSVNSNKIHFTAAETCTDTLIHINTHSFKVIVGH